MNSFVTLSKSDADFQRYLLGTFSSEKIALPVQSLNVFKSDEQITFQVKDISEIPKVSFFTKWFVLLKVKNLIWLLWPSFYLISQSYLDESMLDPWLVVLTIASCFFAFASLSLRNDFRDHITGTDRVFSKAGSRAIQKGWFKAYQIKRFSVIFFILASVLAVPVIFAVPKISIYILFFIIFSVFGFILSTTSAQFKNFSEWSIFWMVGPLFAMGFQTILIGYFDIESIGIGILNGYLAFLYIQIKNFRDIFELGQNQLPLTINQLGFDKSLFRIKKLWFSYFCMHFIFMWVYFDSYSLLLFTLMNFAIYYLILKKSEQIRSPLGSQIQLFYNFNRYCISSLLFLWMIQNLLIIVSSKFYE